VTEEIKVPGKMRIGCEKIDQSRENIVEKKIGKFVRLYKNGDSTKITKKGGI
jgi:hypothetical protein